MSERIYNLFLFMTGDLIEQLGVVAHDAEGSDAQKLRVLQSAVRDDYGRAKRYPLPDRFRVVVTIDGEQRQVPRRLSYPGYDLLAQASRHLELFEELFEDVGAPVDPLICITPIRDGVPHIEGVEHFGIGPLT